MMEERLKELQSWVYNVITHPENVDEGAKRQAIDKQECTIEGIVAPSDKMSSHERINIYRNGYFLRLLECFKHEFKGLYHALGDEMFNHFVWNYLQAYPSTSYTLNELGKMFPPFLEKSLMESLNGAEPDWWQLFIIDVASYERAYVETYNGAGHESLESNELFEEVPLKLSPAVRSLRLNFSIAECITAFRNNDFDSIPDPQPTNYVLTRRNYRVVIHMLDEIEFEALHDWMDRPDQGCPNDYKINWEKKGIGYC